MSSRVLKVFLDSGTSPQWLQTSCSSSSHYQSTTPYKGRPRWSSPLVGPNISGLSGIQDFVTGRYAVIGCKLKQNANEGCNSCATVLQVLQDLFYVLLHVLFYLWSLLKLHFAKYGPPCVICCYEVFHDVVYVHSSCELGLLVDMQHGNGNEVKTFCGHGGTQIGLKTSVWWKETFCRTWSRRQYHQQLNLPNSKLVESHNNVTNDVDGPTAS